MLLQKAILIFASTPEENENPLEEIVNATYNGQKVCEYINFQLTCDECKPICNINPGHMCPHRIGWRPPMHDPEIIGISKAAYGDSESFQREIMGTQVKTMNLFIPQDAMDQIRNSKPYKFDTPPDFVIISCDPAGSHTTFEDGQRSKYALVTACIVDAKVVVIYVYILSVYMYVF